MSLFIRQVTFCRYACSARLVVPSALIEGLGIAGSTCLLPIVGFAWLGSALL